MTKRAAKVERGDYVYDDGTTIFVWEISKADKVVTKRKIDLVEVASVFEDPLALPEPDKTHAKRGNYIGASEKLRILMIVYIEVLEDSSIRIITARKADAVERRRYVNAQRPKADTDARGRQRRLGRSRRDPSSSPTFLEFFHAHHPSYRPKMANLPPKNFRSRLTGTLARIQERGWALAHAKRLNTVGERLGAIRKFAGLTQAGLAKLSMVPQASISRIERGVERLGLRRGESLAKALRIQPSELLWGRK